MLDDRTGRACSVELADAFDGGIGVVDVVVGKLLALDLACGRDAEAGFGEAIEGGLLMRIFAVTQLLLEKPAEREGARRLDARLAQQPVGNRRIISRRSRIGLGGETATQGERG